MKTEDLIVLMIIGTYALFSGIEAVFPARSYPTTRGWRFVGLGFFIMTAVISTFLPLALPSQWVSAHRLFDLTSLPLAVGVLVGWFVLSFFNYLWHRSTHSFELLWSMFHQLHHAPQRLDIASSVILHPVDIGMYVLLSTAVTTLVLGLSPEASAITGFVAQFYSFFQHLNVKTPHWIGYLIQRPEAHFVHHQRNVHGYNYADFPLWDLLFGSFRSPASFGAEEVGFASPSNARYISMLAGQDVSASIGTQTQRNAQLNTPQLSMK